MGCLLIKGGRVVDGLGIIEADILVSEGVIEAVGRELGGPSCEKIDADGMLVLPGIIDEHVHFREPGYEYKEDFESGSKSAAAGGVTTVMDMPNTDPPTDSKAKLEEKARLASGRSYVDYGLYCALHDGNLDEVEGMMAAGAVGLKVYMGETTGKLPSPHDATMLEALGKSARLGFPMIFHAENGDLLHHYIEMIKGTGRSDPRAWAEARPSVCEEEAVSRVITLARRTGGYAHIAHVSSIEAVDLLSLAAQEGLQVTGEVTPHHLLLDMEDYDRYGTLIKVNPPVRGGGHREALWWAIETGLMATVASDHAPHTRDEKEGGIWDSSSGIPGVQTLLPLMLDQALRGRMTLSRLVELLSENPARIMGLYPRKGALKPGSDADIVIVDPNDLWEVREEDLYLKHDVSPYIGRKLKGRIGYTILRGEVVAIGGEVVGGPHGRWIMPPRGPSRSK